jgi:hypothetical protein
MSLDNFNHPEVAKVLPGALGSLTALLFLKGPWQLKLGMFLAGAVFARYGTATLVTYANALDPGFAGYILGLVGMAIVAKVFEVWEKLEFASLFHEALRKLLGLGPRKDGE